jgi:hypothetical protein
MKSKLTTWIFLAILAGIGVGLRPRAIPAVAFASPDD